MVESVDFKNTNKAHENEDTIEITVKIQMKAFLLLFLQLYQNTKNAWKS